MGSFELGGFREPVIVTLPDNISPGQLQKWPAFITWKSALLANLELQYSNENHAFHKTPFTLKSIEVQSVDRFGDRIGFLKLKSIIQCDTQDLPDLPGIALLRGGSVAVLMILRPKDSRDERWVIMTEQPRIPVGSLSFMEIPAGMMDDEQNFSGAAATEIEEETGFSIPERELIDMTELALKDSEAKERSIKPAMYPSPGGCDEYIALFLWEKELDRQEIEDLRGRVTGKRTQGEMITLRICEYEDLWKEGARDAKTLAAWALYEGLNRSGKLQHELDRLKKAKGGKRSASPTEQEIRKSRTRSGQS